MNDRTHPTLHGDLRAQARFGDLTSQLGTWGSTQPQTDLLITLARFLNDDELATLIILINARVEVAVRPLRELLADVAVLIGETEPIYDTAGKRSGYRLAVTGQLARRLVDAAAAGGNEGGGDR